MTLAQMTIAPVLVVDADAALFRNPLAEEAKWRLISCDPRAVAAAFAAPARRAALLERETAALLADEELPPLRAQALDLMRRHREAGGRVALVVRASQATADALAARLDCVDESVGDVGPADVVEGWLDRRFGVGGWERLAPPADPSLPFLASLALYARTIRTYQWSKNLLVFLPALAAHAFTAHAWFAAFLACLSFSFAASSVYLLNDLLDLQADRAHPRKRRRPLASGEVSLRSAARLAVALAVGALAVAAATGEPALLAVMAGYLAVTVVYSVRLKREPVIDICALAALYTIRIGAGAVAADVSLSMWLLAFSMFIFLSLAAMKRQAELVDAAASERAPSGRGYRVDDLPIVEALAVATGCAATLVSALYITTPDVQELYRSPQYLWIVSAVLLYWLARAAFIAHRGEMDDDPIIFAFRDRVSHACGAVVGLALLAAALL